MKESLSNRDDWGGFLDIDGIVVLLFNDDLFKTNELLNCPLERGVLRDILLSMNNGQGLDIWHTFQQCIYRKIVVIHEVVLKHEDEVADVSAEVFGILR